MKKRNIFLSSLLIISMGLLGMQCVEQVLIVQENSKLIETYFSEEKHESNKEPYLGILELPSIQLKRGFYSFDSRYNSVESNIEIISPYCLPNEACNFILASHSGSANISFFKHLDDLKIKDIAIIYYQKEKTKYELIKKEERPKNGNIQLLEPDSPMLILTTCHKKNNNLQELYYFIKKVSL